MSYASKRTTNNTAEYLDPPTRYSQGEPCRVCAVACNWRQCADHRPGTQSPTAQKPTARGALRQCPALGELRGLPKLVSSLPYIQPHGGTRREPCNGQSPLPAENVLSTAEIVRLVRLFAASGVTRIRLLAASRSSAATSSSSSCSCVLSTASRRSA